MDRTYTNPNNSTGLAHRIPRSNSGPSANPNQRGLIPKNKFNPTPSENKLREISLPVGVEADGYINPLNKDYNALVKENPYTDKVKGFLGGAGGVLSSAGEAIKKILGSLGNISKIGLRKSTNNPTATTVIAGGGAAVAGLFSLKSLISAIKHLYDPKTGSWILSGLQAIIQAGVAVGLGAPFFGKGAQSPFIKRIDGEDVVEVKAILGGVGASFLLYAFTALAEGRLPIISRLPIIKDLAGGIAKDIKSGVESLTSGDPITERGAGEGTQLGLAA